MDGSGTSTAPVANVVLATDELENVVVVVEKLNEPLEPVAPNNGSEVLLSC